MNKYPIPKDLYGLYEKSRWGDARISYGERHGPSYSDAPITLKGLILRIAKAESENTWEQVRDAIRAEFIEQGFDSEAYTAGQFCADVKKRIHARAAIAQAKEHV